MGVPMGVRYAWKLINGCEVCMEGCEVCMEGCEVCMEADQWV